MLRILNYFIKECKWPHFDSEYWDANPNNYKPYGRRLADARASNISSVYDRNKQKESSDLIIIIITKTLKIRFQKAHNTTTQNAHLKIKARHGIVKKKKESCEWMKQ